VTIGADVRVRGSALIELGGIRDIGIAHSEAIESTDVNRYRGIRRSGLNTATGALKLTSGPVRGLPLVESTRS
jgi:hypothetical protein